MRKTNGRCQCLLLLAVASLSPTLCQAKAASAPTQQINNALPAARWIWRDGDPAPLNTFTYFRKSVFLRTLPSDTVMHFAADSNAHVWINGHLLMRKMTRYFEPLVRTQKLEPRPYLHRGWNTVIVLHHNWGPIVTFQRSANLHAGLYLRSPWIQTDDTWRAESAPEFEPSTDQIKGVNGDPRIRFPQIVDGSSLPRARFWTPQYDDSSWRRAVVVTNGPWPASPVDVETRPQQEQSVRPIAVIAAGDLAQNGATAERPIDIASSISRATYQPVRRLTLQASHLISGGRFTIKGNAGDSRYVMVDFGEPVHGFPELNVSSSAQGTLIDFGYGELSLSQYSGKTFVRPDGWIDPERVVGHGYADRYKTRIGSQHVELPDERTARWLSLCIHFKSRSTLHLSHIGFIRSRYPVLHVGSFSTGDADIDRIMQLAMRHARVTMSDALVDTPGREDGMWIEDARPRAELAARWFGETNLRLLLLRLVAESQRSNGNFHPFPPAAYPIRAEGFYDWTVEWAGALFDQYQWSGDAALVDLYWGQLTSLWDLLLTRLDADGLWRSDRVLGDLRVGEPPRTDAESSSIVQAQLIARLRESIQLAKVTHHASQESSWNAALAKLEAGFRRFHRVDAAGTTPAHIPDVVSGTALSTETRGYSQASQVMALLANLLPPDMLQPDIGYAFGDLDGSPGPGVARWNNPTYAYRALRALSDAGRADLAVRHLRERYSPYLAGNARNHVDPRLQGPLGGPLPEYFISRDDQHLRPGDFDRAQPIDETGSHGWAAVPLLWAHDTLLGVRIDSPGGSHLTIAPRSGGLPYIRGVTYTPRGKVSVNWRPALSQLTLHVPKGIGFRLTLPGDLTATTLVSTPAGCTIVDQQTLACNAASGFFAFRRRGSRSESSLVLSKPE